MNVLITRAPEQAVDFINLLSKNKIFPFLLPLIEIIEIDAKIEQTNTDYIIFTSYNAFKYFHKHINKYDLSKTKIVSIGEKTTNYIKSFNINVDYIPEEYSAKGIVKLFEQLQIKHKRILIPGSCKRDTYLEDRLAALQNTVTVLNIYDTRPVYYKEGYIKSFIEEHNIHIITFFSPSTVHSFFEQIYLDVEDIKVIAIGKTTAEALNAYNKKSLIPSKATTEGVVELIKKITNVREV